MDRNVVALVLALVGCGRWGFDPRTDGDGGSDTSIDAASRGLDASWAPKWDSVFGYWPLDGAGAIGSGQVVAARVGPNGAASNGNASGMAFVPGMVDSGIQFDNTDDYVELGNSTNLNVDSGSFTLAVWVRAPDQPLAVTIAAKRSNASPFTGYSLTMCGANSHLCTTGRRVVFCIIETLSSKERCGYTSNVIDGAWHHIVAVADSTADSQQVFVDGVATTFVQDFKAGAWPNPNTTQPLLIGNNNGTYYFSGVLDEIALWRVALTPAEVQAIYVHQITL